jgi:hypothetical protein
MKISPRRDSEFRSGMGLGTSRTRNRRANPHITTFRTHGFVMAKIAKARQYSVQGCAYGLTYNEGPQPTRSRLTT